MQRDGAEILIDELQRQWGVKIDYGPEFGVLFLPKGTFVPDESRGCSMIAFGRCAAMLQRMAADTGRDPKDMITGGLDLMRQLVEAFDQGSKLIVTERDGTVVEEWKTLTEFHRHADRKAEMNDDDA